MSQAQPTMPHKCPEIQLLIKVKFSTHPILPLPSTKTLARHGSLRGQVTQSFISAVSGPLVVLPE